MCLKIDTKPSCRTCHHIAHMQGCPNLGWCLSMRAAYEHPVSLDSVCEHYEESADASH